MTLFIIRRLLIAIPTLIGISLILFAIVASAPGDPFAEAALNPNFSPELQQKLRHDLGVDDPIYIQYFRWSTSLLRGNWGESFVNKIPVWDLIKDRLPTTLFVVGMAYVVALLIALPVGIISAVKQYSWVDNVFTTFAFLGYSLPTFFTGLLFILIFTVKLGWLPEIYTTNIQESGFGWFVAMAKQAAMPVMMPAIFTGALVTEQIFRVPGIGSLLIRSLNQHDTFVVMGIVFTYSILVVFFTLLADIAYGVLDPRIKYS